MISSKSVEQEARAAFEALSLVPIIWESDGWPRTLSADYYFFRAGLAAQPKQGPHISRESATQQIADLARLIHTNPKVKALVDSLFGKEPTNA